MRRAIVMAAAAALLACSDGGPSSERFFAVLSGGNEVPPSVSAASGTTTFTVSGSTLNYAVVVQSITDVTTVQLDSGAAGDVGPVLATLYSGPTTGAIAYGTLVAGSLAQAQVSVPMDSLLSWMRRSRVYVNILTTSQPAGEIRGQVTPN